VIEIACLVPADGNERARSLLLMLLLAIALAADFFMMLALASIPRLPIVYFPLFQTTLGCTLAQGCLLAAWLAWGDQPFGQRLMRHWIVAVSLYLVWVAGLWVVRGALGQSGQFRLLSLMVGLAVPLLSIAAQLPLWVARHMLGWRVVQHESQPDYQNAGARSEPLTIRDLMTATVVVAVALALARWAPSPDGKPIGILWAFLFAAATIISGMTLLPFGLLLLRKPHFGRGVLFATLYAAFWIALPLLSVLVAWGQGFFPPPPLPILLGQACLVLSFTVTVILAAAAARCRGYRLITGRVQHRRSPV
jgi:hypothetical protein